MTSVTRMTPFSVSRVAPTFSIFSLALLCLAIFGAKADAQSQLELNEKANYDAAIVKKQTDKLVRTLSAQYGSIKGFKAKLDEAQELYDNYIAAHLRERFPVPKKGDERMMYGSINGMCQGNLRAQMYQARLDELKNWGKGAGKADLVALKKEYNTVDRKLNDVYVKVKTGKAAKDSETGQIFKKNLTDAEITWIAFRNTDSEVYGMSANSEASRFAKMIELTRKRTAQLNEWIKGAQEGDTCAGSIPLM